MYNPTVYIILERESSQIYCITIHVVGRYLNGAIFIFTRLQLCVYLICNQSLFLLEFSSDFGHVIIKYGRKYIV